MSRNDHSSEKWCIKRRDALKGVGAAGIVSLTGGYVGTGRVAAATALDYRFYSLNYTTTYIDKLVGFNPESDEDVVDADVVANLNYPSGMDAPGIQAFTLSFAPGGTLYSVSWNKPVNGQDQQLFTVDVDTGDITLVGDNPDLATVPASAFSPDGDTLYVVNKSDNALVSIDPSDASTKGKSQLVLTGSEWGDDEGKDLDDVYGSGYQMGLGVNFDTGALYAVVGDPTDQDQLDEYVKVNTDGEVELLNGDAVKALHQAGVETDPCSSDLFAIRDGYNLWRVGTEGNESGTKIGDVMVNGDFINTASLGSPWPQDLGIACPCELDLIAGQNMDVGDVRISQAYGEVTVEIETEDDWCLTELHLHAANTEDEIPQQNDNPKPGQFQFGEEFEECEDRVVRSIPAPDDPEGDGIVVAIHAVVADSGAYDAAGGLGSVENEVFGVGRFDDLLYRLSLEDNTATEISDTRFSGSYVNSPNGLAYDPESQRLYYTIDPTGDESDASELWFYDFDTDEHENARPGEKLAGFNVGAAWYDGQYYYIPNGTDDLRVVSFDDDGHVESDDMAKENFTGTDKAYRFGDVAIDSDGVLYASTNGTGGSTAELFTLDLSDYTYTELYPAGAPDDWSRDPSGLQLAFDDDDSLIGHSAGSGEFFAIDGDDKTILSLGYVPDSLDALTFTDLANGPREVETETAWADGCYFNADAKGNWAMYVEFNADPEDYKCGCVTGTDTISRGGGKGEDNPGRGGPNN